MEETAQELESTSLDNGHVTGSGPFLSLRNYKFDAVTFIERPEPFSLDLVVVYKNIAIPLSIGAQMIGRGDVQVRGVVPPETAIQPGIFFAELAKRGIEIHQRVETYHRVA